MTTYVWRNGEIVEKDKAVPREWKVSVISDNMEPIKHHGTGRIVDSKSRFRADTKASGCIEIGTEQIRQRAPIRLDKRERRQAIARSIYELRNGR